MEAFYKNYIAGQELAAALQAAMQQIREQHPHPYFWAPFVLAGKITEKNRLN
jgi:CHAT domain-containing protein